MPGRLAALSYCGLDKLAIPLSVSVQQPPSADLHCFSRTFLYKSAAVTELCLFVGMQNLAVHLGVHQGSILGPILFFCICCL